MAFDDQIPAAVDACSPQLGVGEDTAYWFAAQLKPGRFMEAERNLGRQNIVSFMPTRLTDIRRNRRLVKERRPLFPGYIFVRFDPEITAFRTVNSTYGISRLIMRDGHAAATVPRTLISSLMTRCDSAGNLRPPVDFKVGENVKILSGPMQNFVATIEQVSADKRVQVLLDLMGQSVRVSVGTMDVEKVSAGA